LTDEPKSQRFKSNRCAHIAAAEIRRAGWREWSRLWRKSGRVYSDVSGIQAHSGLYQALAVFSGIVKTQFRGQFQIQKKVMRRKTGHLATAKVYTVRLGPIYAALPNMVAKSPL
jgi:hypothetical protein